MSTIVDVSTEADAGPRKDPRRHGPLEDAFAMLIGTVLVAVGLEMFRRAGIAIGGTAGIAFLIYYVTGLPLGMGFFLVNLPFYAFSWRVLGLPFTLKTFAAVSMLSLESSFMPELMVIERVNPLFAALGGGLLVGMGLLSLIRHKASLGGLGVLGHYMQERHGIRAGKVQMGADCVIVGAALFVLPFPQVALSVFGAVAMNLVLAVNHKPGRYNGF